MARLDELVLILEAPQNWPPGGVYNMALYPGEYGPHQAGEASPRATPAFLSKAQCKLACLLSAILTTLASILTTQPSALRRLPCTGHEFTRGA
jgi:hypothetical protein